MGLECVGTRNNDTAVATVAYDSGVTVLVEPNKFQVSGWVLAPVACVLLAVGVVLFFLRS